MGYKNEIRDITNFIHENVTDGFTWDMLASRMHISKYHFHRLFSYEMGIPVARYIREQKLRYARLLLINTNKSITEIAYGLYFNSHDAFTRAFRLRYNQTPVNMRKYYRTQTWLHKTYFKKRKDGFIMKYMTDTELKVYSPFTVGDKRDCLETAETIMNIHETIQKEGILAAHDELNDTDLFLLE